jgi:nucleotide-binding universal stress UspA family protein
VNIHHILCPIDFSDASAHGLDHAAMIAGWYKARVTALHVANPVLLAVPGVSSPRGGGIHDSELAKLREQAADFCRASIPAAVALNVLVDVGQPAARILDRIADLSPDLVVLGTHGAGGFEHLVLGSVTEKVLRKAACPVVTVPPRAHATSQLPYRRVLCAVDFSDPSLAGLEYATSLSRESNAALTVLHVLEWPWEEPPPPALEELPVEQASALAEYRRYVEGRATARLESLAAASPAGSGRPAVRLGNGKPYVQILDVAAQEQADLIVIGVRGRSPLDVAFFGSTANQVVRRARCPVLTLRGGRGR